MIKKAILLLVLLMAFNLAFSQNLNKLILEGRASTEKVIKTVLKRPHKINKQQDKNGNFPLHTAVLTEQLDYVNLLVSNGANIDVQNNQGFTPLMLAVQKKYYEICIALHQRKPDLKLSNIFGHTVLDLIEDESIRWLIGTEEHLADYVTNLNELEAYQKKFPHSKFTKTLGEKFYKEIRTQEKLYALHDLKIVDPAKIDEKAASMVHDIPSLKTFYKKFPKSRNYETTVKKMISDLKREELLTILELYPGISFSTKIKENYAKQSRNLEECVESLRLFPELATYLESTFRDYVKDVSDAQEFHHFYPESRYDEAIVQEITEKSGRNELLQLIKVFPDVPSIAKTKEKYVKSSPNLGSFLDALSLFPEWNLNAAQDGIQYITNLKDAKLYRQRFTDTTLYENAYLKGLKEIKDKKDILQLNFAYSDLDSAILAQGRTKYVDLCKTIMDCRKAADLFPEMSEVIELKAFQMVSNFEGCNEYIQNFHNSPYTREVKEKSRYFLQKDFEKCDTEYDYENFIEKYSRIRNLYDPDGLLSLAEVRIEEMIEYREFIKSAKNQANTAGSQLMSCCSTFGGQNFSVRVNEEDIEIDKYADLITIPMTVNWYGSLSGRHYWIKGTLFISPSGRRWNKISDSGGFSPGCSQNCIR